MKVIKLNEAASGANSEQITILEYYFLDKDIDLGIAIITGSYPTVGYCINTISKGLIYVLDG